MLALLRYGACFSGTREEVSCRMCKMVAILHNFLLPREVEGIGRAGGEGEGGGGWHNSMVSGSDHDNSNLQVFQLIARYLLGVF